MNARFHADCVFVGQEESVAMVGFSDHEFDTNEYVLLQRSLEGDSQQDGSALDDVHIERNSQAWSTYGGIASVHLMPTQVVIKVDEDAAAKLGGASSIEVTYKVDTERLEELRQGLREVFRGCECLLDESGL